MRVCIDSNQFIFGLAGTDPDSEAMLLLLPYLEVVLPRLIVREVTRNLTEVHMRTFYTLLEDAHTHIVDEPVPASLVDKYVSLGLRMKADALIGAFVEWQGANFLISDNRHFLVELKTEAFEVLRPDEFLRRFRGEIPKEDG
jgi:predicted nucleic acid-binding protein